MPELVCLLFFVESYTIYERKILTMYAPYTILTKKKDVIRQIPLISWKIVPVRPVLSSHLLICISNIGREECKRRDVPMNIKKGGGCFPDQGPGSVIDYKWSLEYSC